MQLLFVTNGYELEQYEGLTQNDSAIRLMCLACCACA